MALYYHEELGRVTDGPDSAQANMAQSGWRRLSDEEADQYRAEQDEKLRALEEETAAAVEYSPSVAAEAPAPDDAVGGALDAQDAELDRQAARIEALHADPATTEKGN